MSTRIIRAVAAAEQADDMHVARLLVLLLSSGGRSGTKPVEGIMKLAKLDFLLRYPNSLARALRNAGEDERDAALKDYEYDTIESRMVRFRYGPWDGRYRRWISLLHARGLGTTQTRGRTVLVALTPKGIEVAKILADTPEFTDIRKRSRLIARLVGDLSATRIKEYIYEQFPELIDMRWGEEISV